MQTVGDLSAYCANHKDQCPTRTLLGLHPDNRAEGDHVTSTVRAIFGRSSWRTWFLDLKVPRNFAADTANATRSNQYRFPPRHLLRRLLDDIRAGWQGPGAARGHASGTPGKRWN